MRIRERQRDKRGEMGNGKSKEKREKKLQYSTMFHFLLTNRVTSMTGTLSVSPDSAYFCLVSSVTRVQTRSMLIVGQ